PVERTCLLLPRPHFVERVAIVEAAVLHDVADRFRVANVLERIPVEHEEIRLLPRLERSNLFAQPERLGAEYRRDAEHVVWREAAHGHRPHLPMVAQPFELSMRADASTAASCQKILDVGPNETHDILVVREPPGARAVRRRIVGSTPPK